jgi:folate-dependent phosphoribosylglycinamide formyltransferase PurN
MKNNISSIFLGTRIEVLEKFAKLTNVKEIYTTKNSFVSLYFNKKGIKKFIFNQKNKQEIFKKITNAKVKIVLSAGFPYIIPKKVLNKKRLYLNSHPSLLPKYIEKHFTL